MGAKNKVRNLVPDGLLSIIKKSIFYIHSFSEKLLRKYFDTYDYQTIHIIRKYMKPDDNYIDVGAHKGLILKELLQQAPKGKGFAFEPLPYLYKRLKQRYDRKVTLYDYALSDTAGEAEFTFNTDRPAVSGFRQRMFEDATNIETLKVKVETLDNLIPAELPIQVIKIDVEGAELGVLKGAERILKTSRPIVLFEFGLGGADLYDTKPEMVFDFLSGCGLSLSTLQLFLEKKEHLSREEFVRNYYKTYDYFFIAYDADRIPAGK